MEQNPRVGSESVCGKELGQLSGLKMMTEDSKTASVVPLKEEKLLEVDLGELPSWILMRDFTPSGIAGAFQRGQSLMCK